MGYSRIADAPTHRDHDYWRSLVFRINSITVMRSTFTIAIAAATASSHLIVWGHVMVFSWPVWHTLMISVKSVVIKVFWHFWAVIRLIIRIRFSILSLGSGCFIHVVKWHCAIGTHIEIWMWHAAADLVRWHTCGTTMLGVGIQCLCCVNMAGWYRAIGTHLISWQFMMITLLRRSWRLRAKIVRWRDLRLVES